MLFEMSGPLAAAIFAVIASRKRPPAGRPGDVILSPSVSGQVAAPYAVQVIPASDCAPSSESVSWISCVESGPTLNTFTIQVTRVALADRVNGPSLKIATSDDHVSMVRETVSVVDATWPSAEIVNWAERGLRTPPLTAAGTCKVAVLCTGMLGIDHETGSPLHWAPPVAVHRIASIALSEIPVPQVGDTVTLFATASPSLVRMILI